MARTLTGNTTTAKNKPDDVAPYNLLKVEWGGTVGTKWYADRDVGDADASAWNKAKGRVDDWGGITVRTALHPRPVVGQVSIRLLDADQVLHGFRIDEQLENKTVTVYQQYVGNVEADLTIIFKGVVNAPVKWVEDGRVLLFSITDMGSHYDREFGTTADRDTFKAVFESDEGKMLPIVYGAVKRAPTVFAQAGLRGRLQNPIAGVDTSEVFYIEGGENFPQSTPTTIRVGHEHITGEFVGTAFTPSARGVAIANGTILGTTENPRVFATTFTGVDGQYAGYFLKVSVEGHDGPGFQNRRIIRSTAGGEIEIAFPFYYQGYVQEFNEIASDIFFGVGQQYWVPPQTGAVIVTQARPHQPGEEVVEILEEYIYIANDRPSKRVEAVYGFGRKMPRNSVLDDIDGLQPGEMGMMVFGTMQRWNAPVPTDDAGESPPGDFLGSITPSRDTWVAIDPSLYTIDLNDSTSFPGLDHNVTTIKFAGLPPAIMGLYDFGSEELRTDIAGIDATGDGTGALVENPSDVIKNFLENIGGVAAGDTDDASFTDVEGRMGGLLFAFSLQRRSTLMTAVQSLAFQCRCSVNWDDGKAYLRWLVNGPETSVVTISDSKRLIDSWEARHIDFETEVYSEVIAKWMELDEEREIAVSDATAEAEHGKKTLPIDLWAVTTKAHAKVLAQFWLRRLNKVLTVFKWSDYLDTLEIQRNDTVTFSVATYAPTGAKGTILEIVHTPGRGIDSEIDQIDYEAINWWCESSCQGFCETAGCETAMQINACTGVCEVGCQGYCELECVTAAQIVCITGAQIFDCEFVEAGDLFGCETTGTETACDTASGGCQFSCTTGSCTTCNCQACACQLQGCQNSCQGTTCETVGCETCACQTCGCETICETGGCETSCETISCECGCEGGCTAECETASQSACDCSEQICTECQIAGCQIDCEPVACEGTCQCTCTIGCECECERGTCQLGLQ